MHSEKQASEKKGRANDASFHDAQKQLAVHLREIRQQIQQPIYFLRGDYDEVAWLHQFSQGEQNKTIPIDPFDLFHYVPDGTIMHCDGLTLAFFGGVEHPDRGKEGTEHDPAAFTALLRRRAKRLNAGGKESAPTHPGNTRCFLVTWVRASRAFNLSKRC